MTAQTDQRPERYAQWVEALPDDVEFCFCPGVTWVNRDPTTSRPCPTCGKLRNDDMCVVATRGLHERKGCRSTDSAHLKHAAWMMETGQLLGQGQRDRLVGEGHEGDRRDAPDTERGLS